MVEKILTFLFLFGGMAYLVDARTLAFGSLGSPKSGFLPMLAGTLAVVLALVIMIRERRMRPPEKKDQLDWMKFAFVLIGLLFYIIALKLLGYFFATFIFLTYLFKVADLPGWIAPLGLGAGLSVALYFLFERFLMVPLP